MDFVDPIRDKKKISQIKNQLDGAKRYRDLLLFVTGINTALRISDLLQLRVGSFADEQRIIQDKFTIREEKRDKRNQVVINDSVRDALEKYLMAYPDIVSDPSYFLFFTSKRSGPTYTKAMTRVQAWRLVAEMCHSVGLVGNFGTHTLRKT